MPNKVPTNTDTTLETIVKFARRKGFVFQSSEIYGGFSATYDFGPLGSILRENLINAWRYWNVISRTDVEEIQGAIFMHPKVWEASGHIGGFSDLLVEDVETRKRYRADHLIEDAEVKLPSFLDSKGMTEEEVNALENEYRAKGLDVAVDCLITNDKGEVFAQKRTMDRRLYPGCWDFAGGHIEPGDTLYKTIFKEVKEETNWNVSKILRLVEVLDWKIPENAVREGENPNKVILQFEVKIETTDGLVLEEGKADDFLWVNKSNIERLKENREEGDDYIYNSVKTYIESLDNFDGNTKIITNAGVFSPEEIDQIIEHYGIKSPDGNPLSKAKKFNLMVKTHLGPVEDESSLAYLKGEACQNIYLDWKAVQETTRRKLPFGIAQLGKAFRNEITVKQFMFRTREFEQIDLQYFVKPGTENDWYQTWKEDRWDFYTKHLGFSKDNLEYRKHDDDELVFYCKEAWDVNYNFGALGFKEMEGVHNRTSYDTDQHSKFSGADLTYFDPETNERYNPYIVEMSAGINRMFLALMFEFYKEEALEGGDTRIVFKLPYDLAPYKIAVLPLMKKDGLKEKAHEIYAQFRKSGLMADYDETGSIGKRYRRQDENGTPWCMTLDYDTLKDDTVTLRNRDTMEQQRVKIEYVRELISK